MSRPRRVHLARRLYCLGEYLIARAAAASARAGAAISMDRAARILGQLYFLAWDKRCAHANLDVVFRDTPLSAAGKEALLKRIFHGFARTSIEFLNLGQLRSSNWRSRVEIEVDAELLATVDAGRSVLVVTAHFGNWEYLASIPAKMGYRVGVIVNRQLNPYFNPWLNGIRARHGRLSCFYNEAADLRRLVAHLRAGSITGMLADQNFAGRSVAVPFFGAPFPAPIGPAALHLKYDVPIATGFAVRRDDGTYLLRYERPRVFPRSGDSSADSTDVMSWVFSRYEEYIRRWPEQWYSVLFPMWSCAARQV